MVAVIKDLQKYVRLRSTEAEYATPAKAVKTVQWLRNVLSTLGVIQYLSCIFQDSMGRVEWDNCGEAKYLNKQ